MNIKVKKSSSKIDAFSIDASATSSNTSGTIYKSLCITWNPASSNTISPPLGGPLPSSAQALSASEVTLVPQMVFDAHLVVSQQTFASIVSALNTLALTFSITNGDPNFTIVSSASLMERDPDLRLLVEAAQATGEKVGAIEGHLSEIKDLLQGLANQNPQLRTKPNGPGTEYVGPSGPNKVAQS